MMMVRYEVEGTIFKAESPEALFPVNYYSATGRYYDIHPEGRRFLMIKEGSRASGETRQEIIIVLNWFDELKRLVPTE